MKVRRYREGRLVRERRWRKATLQNVRNLVLPRVVGMLATVDRFAAMLEVLRAQGHQAAATGSTGTRAAGCCAATGEAGAEPDTRDRAQPWGIQVEVQAEKAGNPSTTERTP